MRPGPQPLAGRRVLITRSAAQGRELAARLEQLGAVAVMVPLIEVRPDLAPGALRRSLGDLQRHPGPRYALLCSANAVRLVAAELSPDRLPELLEGVTVAAIGAPTARALRAMGLRPDLVPHRSVGEALAAEIIARGARGSRVWIPGAASARRELDRRLAAAGAVVDRQVVYRTLMPPEAPRLLARELSGEGVDVVTLTSGSTVANLVRALAGRPYPAGAVTACIGPVTAAAARAAGITVDAVATRPSPEALAEAVAAALRGHRPPSDT